MAGPGRLAGIIADCGARVPVGVAWRRSLGVGLLALFGLWAAGSLLSFIVNRQQIVSATQRVQLLRQPVVNDQQLIDLQVLRNDIGRLQNQLANGAPGISALVLIIMRRFLPRCCRGMGGLTSV